MICKKCGGQGVVTKIVQLSGSEDDTVSGVMGALLTFGLSLPFTTRTKEVNCPRCNGWGRVGAE